MGSGRCLGRKLEVIGIVGGGVIGGTHEIGSSGESGWVIGHA